MVWTEGLERLLVIEIRFFYLVGNVRDQLP